MDFAAVITVGVGGFLGSISRFLVVYWTNQQINATFPFGTLLVNIVGSFFLGVAVGLFTKTCVNNNIKLLFTTGFCGGFTTFSAFAFENINLIQTRMMWSSFVYIAVSVTAGLLAVFLGVIVGKLIG